MLRPVNPQVWIVGVVVVGGLATLYVATMKLRGREKRMLNDRPDLSDDELFETYFKDSGLPKSVVVELWGELANCLRVPRAKMRPSDRLGKEVGSYWITSEDLDALEVLARRRAQRVGKLLDLSTIHDVDGYVRTVGAIMVR